MNETGTGDIAEHRVGALLMGGVGRIVSTAIRDTDADRDRLRASQLNAVDRLIPKIMLANVVFAGGLTALLFRDHGGVLAWWWVGVAAMSLFPFLRARRVNRNPRRSAGRREVLSTVGQAILMAALITGAPAWLLTQTAGPTFAIVVCQLTGILWAGSLVLATLVPAALAYGVVAVSITTVGLLAGGVTVESLLQVVMFLSGLGTATAGAFEQSKLFAESHRQKVDLERQGEVIGILLKDYEEQTSDWLWEVDADLRFRKPSPRFLQAMAQPLEKVEGTRFDALMSDPTLAGNPEGLTELLAHGAARRPFRDVTMPVMIAEEVRWWSISGRPTDDGQGRFTGYRGVTTDVTATRVAQQRVSHLAHHDALTNLPNRSSFCEALDRALAHPDRSGLAIVSLDLDGFKPVNDRYGHLVGDALLVAVAERLRANVQADDIVARFGGDEFLILSERKAELGAVEALCRRLLDEMVQPFEVLGELVTIGVSIGVAFGPADGDTAEELIKNADAALYRAKGEGRGTVRFFEPEMDRRLRDRQQLMHDLRVALGRGELMLHFQPFVSAAAGTVTGCEALIRWRHPVRGMVSPADFIPLAEENGLIVSIGAWVIEQACLEAARWPDHQRVSVNISPVQFHDRSLPGTILAALTRAGLSPSRLEVEVTETVLIGDSDMALDILRQIRALGVRVALDDFGTGYSSLSYLRNFPFDKVKIDRSFVQDLVWRRDNQVIVQAIRDIATGLGMSITAEGVETEAQAEQLRDTGCEELQGFLFSRPLPSDQYAEFCSPRPLLGVEAA